MDAVRKEKTTPPDDVWVDEDWKKGQANQLANAIGFETNETKNED